MRNQVEKDVIVGVKNGICFAALMWIFFFGLLLNARAEPLPRLAEWESNMKFFGDMHCQTIKGGGDPALAATYYDAQRIYQQIGGYTGEGKWGDCAQAAFTTYGQNYVNANNGNVPGYWIFSRGLADDFRGSGNPSAKLGVVNLSTKAAYARDDTPIGSTADFTLSREVAYSIMAYLDAERVGEPRRARLAVLVNQALSHLDQYADPNKYVKPFFIALTSQALIRYYEEVEKRPEILAKISAIASVLGTAQE